MMIDRTIILLTYYYDYEGRNHRLLRYVKNYLGVYLPFNLYFYEPLQKIFFKVILYDYLKRMTEIGIKAVNEEIIDLVRKEHPKYVLWTSWQYDIIGSTFNTIRKEGAIVVGWFFDDEWRFDNYSKWWIPYLDYCVTNAIEVVPKYRKLNARCILTIPNTGTPICHNLSNLEEKYDISFVGSRFYADREQYINELKNRNMPFYLFGADAGGYVSFEEMIDIFAFSKINLNFSKAYCNKKLQIKGRIFQVCMAGGFLLTEYVPGIEKYFDIDKEIVCFHNMDEMMDKIVYYLDHEVERRAIARAGWERATCEYTCFHMISKVFGEIEEGSSVKDKGNMPHPQKLKMPMRIRKIPSKYYFYWGKALLEDNYNGLWKDALALSVSYNPFDIAAWYYYIIGFFPSFIRPALIKLFGLYSTVVSKLECIPYLRKMKQSCIFCAINGEQ